jgi:hypothetical protein
MVACAGDHPDPDTRLIDQGADANASAAILNRKASRREIGCGKMNAERRGCVIVFTFGMEIAATTG